jgi:hypothetical protein
MMEWWNIGILGQNKKINAKLCALNLAFLKPIIPQFHCSIIPIGAKPLSPVILIIGIYLKIFIGLMVMLFFWLSLCNNFNRLCRYLANFSRTLLKNASNAQELRYRPPQNTHITIMYAGIHDFFVGRCLATLNFKDQMRNPAG